VWRANVRADEARIASMPASGNRRYRIEAAVSAGMGQE
jgi:hypothetical protein